MVLIGTVVGAVVCALHLKRTPRKVAVASPLFAAPVAAEKLNARCAPCVTNAANSPARPECNSEPTAPFDVLSASICNPAIAGSLTIGGPGFSPCYPVKQYRVADSAATLPVVAGLILGCSARDEEIGPRVNGRPPMHPPSSDPTADARSSARPNWAAQPSASISGSLFFNAGCA